MWPRGVSLWDFSKPEFTPGWGGASPHIRLAAEPPLQGPVTNGSGPHANDRARGQRVQAGDLAPAPARLATLP